MNAGDKIEYLGLCYKIAAVKDGVATIKPLRVPKKNPRGRVTLKQVAVDGLKKWEARA